MHGKQFISKMYVITFNYTEPMKEKLTAKGYLMRKKVKMELEIYLVKV